MALLERKQIKHGLRHTEGWKISDSQLQKTFSFANFTEAANFVKEIAPIADELNHHPDVSVTYNKVSLSLATHEEGGVTERDIELALAIERQHDAR